MRLAALLELIVKVVTLDTAPPIVAAPLPELMVRAEPVVPPAFTTTIPEPP